MIIQKGINMTANRSKTPQKLLVLRDDESQNSPVSTDRGIRKNTTDKTKHSISPLKSAHFSPTPSDIPVLGESGGLLDGFFECAQASPGSRPGSHSGSRPGSSSSKSVPPSPHSGSNLRRQPTPTKQISLQAVKRKEEKEGPIPLEPNITWSSFIRTPRSFPNTFRASPEPNKGKMLESRTNEEGNAGAHAVDSEFSSSVAVSASGLTNSSGPTQPERPDLKTESLYNQDDRQKEDEESSSGTEEDDLIGHKGKAPNNLLMEFLTAVMEKDYQTASKLCKMILIYEPDNKEALMFAPLIEEKIKLDEEADLDGTEEDDDEEEENDDEDDDIGEDEDDSVEDNDEDEDEEDEEQEGSDHDSESENESDGPLDSGFSDGI